MIIDAACVAEQLLTYAQITYVALSTVVNNETLLNLIKK
jgi:hypothetical protein